MDYHSLDVWMSDTETKDMPGAVFISKWANCCCLCATEACTCKLHAAWLLMGGGGTMGFPPPPPPPKKKSLELFRD